MERASMSHPDLRVLAAMPAPRPGSLRGARDDAPGTPSKKGGPGGGPPGSSPRGGRLGPSGLLTGRRPSLRLLGAGAALVALGVLAAHAAAGRRSGIEAAGGALDFELPPPGGGVGGSGGGGGGGGSALGTARAGAGATATQPLLQATTTGLAALCGDDDAGAADAQGLAQRPGGRKHGPGGAGTPAPAPVTHPGLAPCLAPRPDSSDPGAIVGQPTVALMFLSAGDMAHAGTWAAWLRGGDGALRADCVAAEVCAARPPARDDDAPAAGSASNGDPPRRRRLAGSGSSAVTAARDAAVARLATAAGAQRARGGALASQSLFTVYVHTPPNVTLKAGSPFAGREVGGRVPTQWGDHSLVAATRRLLQAALEEPRNQRFVLLSETCAPLYPAAATYVQLMAEAASRVNACIVPGKDRGEARFSPRMVRGILKQEHWRKSSQWVTLTRRHAAALAQDTDVIDTFARFCVNGYDADVGGNRWCHSDEHYIPTALAAFGLENETDCVGGATAVDWSGGGSHPTSYWHHDISGDLIERLRASDDGCEPAAAMHAAPAVLVRPDQLAPGAPPRCAWQRAPRAGPGAPPAPPALGPRCTLFARKFVPEAAERLLGLVEGDDGLRLLERPQPACRG